MGIEQVSLFLYPPRWQQHATPVPHSLTWENKPVQIVSAMPADHVDDAPVPPELLKDWLICSGFTQANWGDGDIFDRGQVRSIFGAQQEIQIHANRHDGEVAELYCRFTLPHPRVGPPPLDEWARFTAALCAEFHLRLPGHTQTCDEPTFLDLVRADHNYQSHVYKE
jgi:hypothetical protein